MQPRPCLSASGFRQPEQADLPRGLFQNLVLDHDQTALSSGQEVCIGSTSRDRSLLASRSKRPVQGMFLGMVSNWVARTPYVRNDANLHHAIENIADGAFFNSGQSCCAVERVYVHETHFDEVVNGLVEAARMLVLGIRSTRKQRWGRWCEGRSRRLSRKQMQEAIEQGAVGWFQLVRSLKISQAPLTSLPKCSSM
ncbi:MAG: aldehyde dehydrogenase family protein [Planctomycetaceae bacterium]